MKKFVIFTLISAMAAGAVFAADGININAWGRGVFAPLVVKGAPKTDGKVDQYSDQKGKTVDKKASAFVGTGATWGGGQVRVDFRIVGDSEFVGFGLNATAENNTLAGNDDAAYIYAKPFGGDILKIKIGYFVEDELRGKIGTANNTFDNFVSGGRFTNYDEDHIFMRFATSDGMGHLHSNNGLNGAGFLLSSLPVDGLFIGLLATAGNPVPSGVSTTAWDAYHFMQIGAGYQIPNIGHIRAQWIGGYLGSYDDKKLEKTMLAGGASDFDKKPARIEAAFALTAVENLLVDLGGKFYLPVNIKDVSKSSGGIGIGLGASFRVDAFSIIFRFDGDFAAYERAWEDDKSLGGANLDFRLTPTYDLDAATIGLLFGLQTALAGKDWEGNGPDEYNAPLQLGFGGYVQKGLGKGSIKAGLTFTTATIIDSKANGSPYFSIPIVLEYAFF